MPCLPDPTADSNIDEQDVKHGEKTGKLINRIGAEDVARGGTVDLDALEVDALISGDHPMVKEKALELSKQTRKVLAEEMSTSPQNIISTYLKVSDSPLIPWDSSQKDDAHLDEPSAFNTTCIPHQAILRKPTRHLDTVSRILFLSDNIHTESLRKNDKRKRLSHQQS